VEIQEQVALAAFPAATVAVEVLDILHLIQMAL
jgi:hypothetical protein